MTAPRFTADGLCSWAGSLLAASGLREDACDTVADTLVAADLRGVSSHGVVRLPIYLQRIERGLVDRDPKPVVVRQGGAVALIDAVASREATAPVVATNLASTWS